MYTSGNVTLMVSDFNRAVSFYTDTLGLTLKARYGDDWAEVELPGITIGLHPTGNRGPSAIHAEGVSVGLGVTDIQQAVADLQARGVSFAPPGIIDTGAEKLANFHDPDQTPLYLYEMAHH
ncbi:MAG: VOC family protein [Chloroflexi bacterium]|nr:VOC family protein [Chloroflexota bacterium]